MDKFILFGILVIILMCLLSLLVVAWNACNEIIGEGEDEPLLPIDAPADIVVDTLNLTYWMRKHHSNKPLSVCEIIGTIDTASPLLKKKFSRITFITKDKTTRNDDLYHTTQVRALYRSAAKRNGVFIDVVEQLPAINIDNLKPAAKNTNTPHATHARDDFYILKTAWEQKAAILSCDKYKDFREMKSGVIPPFHVFKFSPWSDTVTRDYIHADAPEFRKLRRPRYIFRPEEVLPA